MIEIHGGGARGALSRVVRLGKGALPDPGRLGIGDLIDAGGQPIDEVVVGYVPAREAWSGMDTWTLGIHGGHWIQSRACEMLRGLGGRDLDLRGVLRLAVETKALDAPRAAAFELLTAARTERAARFFVRQHSGELSGRLSTIAGLLRCGDREEALALVRETLAGSRAAYRLGHPLRLLIAGRTNAGKSTLLNRLVGAERAVVTADPGTTRDLIEATVAIADYPVVLVDSAGIRPAGTVGSVEREGILRADPAHFDGMLYLVPPPWELTLEDERHLSRVDASRRLTVASMSDRVEGRGAPGADLRLSAVTGEGIAELRRVLVERWIDDRGGDDVDVPCACFLEHQIHVLSRVLQAPAEAGVALDAVRWALVESLLEIWPTTEDPEANSAHGSRRAAASNREPPDDNGMSRREA